MAIPLSKEYKAAKYTPTDEEKMAAIEAIEKREVENQARKEKEASKKQEKQKQAEAKKLRQKKAKLKLDAHSQGLRGKERDFYADNILKEEATGVPGALARTEASQEPAGFATQSDPQEEPQDIDHWDQARGAVYSGMAGSRAAVEAEKAALQTKSKEEKEGLDKIADEEVTAANAFAIEHRALKAMQAKHQAGLDAYQKGTEELEDDYNNRKIDPNRAFSSTGARVASAIAIALGAFAQGASRGKIPNTAFEIIEGAIKRDIDVQKTEMQKSRDVLLNRNNIYARMMSRYQNEEVAFSQTMAMGYKHAKMKIDAMASKHKSAMAQQTLAVASAKMDREYAFWNEKGAKTVAEIHVKQAQHHARSGAAQTKRSDSTNLALKTIALLPKLQKDFLNVSAMQGAWATVLPHTVKSWFSGMADEIKYENSKNLNAKALTKAFDGGRPTEKDFQIFVQMFPVSSADQDVGVIQFGNVRENLTTMVVNEGGLKPGLLTKAWEAKHGEVIVSPEAKALFEKSKNWEFKQGM